MGLSWALPAHSFLLPLSGREAQPQQCPVSRADNGPIPQRMLHITLTQALH